MPTKPVLSIIIVNFNTRDLIIDCIDKVVKNTKIQKIPYEIIVIDNNSNDGSVQAIKDRFKDVSIIENKQNFGYGKANNQGIKIAQGGCILLLNSDVLVRPGAVEKLFNFHKRHPDSYVGGKLYNLDGSIQPSCGPFFSIPVVFAVMFLKGDKWGLTRFSPKKERRVDWLSGACLMAQKSTFEKDLYFDESQFLYMEEVDLLYRAFKKGVFTYFCPYAKFLHIGAASSKDRKDPVINIYKGLIWFYKKHHKFWKIIAITYILRLKAVTAIIIGILSANKNLKNKYAQALSVVKK